MCGLYFLVCCLLFLLLLLCVHTHAVAYTRTHRRAHTHAHSLNVHACRACVQCIRQAATSLVQSSQLPYCCSVVCCSSVSLQLLFLLCCLLLWPQCCCRLTFKYSIWAFPWWFVKFCWLLLNAVVLCLLFVLVCVLVCLSGVSKYLCYCCSCWMKKGSYVLCSTR